MLACQHGQPCLVAGDCKGQQFLMVISKWGVRARLVYWAWLHVSWM